MNSPAGPFIEYVHPRAFDNVLARSPDVLLTVDHDTRYTLARTNGTLELSADSKGLRFFATCVPTSYAKDLKLLMEANIVSDASFLFRVAPGGEEWESRGNQVIRTIYEIGDLFDVCICAAGAYPAASSELRSLFLDYAVQRKFITTTPEVSLAAAKARARLRRVA